MAASSSIHFLIQAPFFESFRQRVLPRRQFDLSTQFNRSKVGYGLPQKERRRQRRNVFSSDQTTCQMQEAN